MTLAAILERWHSLHAEEPVDIAQRPGQQAYLHPEWKIRNSQNDGCAMPLYDPPYQLLSIVCILASKVSADGKRQAAEVIDNLRRIPTTTIRLESKCWWNTSFHNTDLCGHASPDISDVLNRKARSGCASAPRTGPPVTHGAARYLYELLSAALKHPIIYVRITHQDGRLFSCFWAELTIKLPCSGMEGWCL